MYVIAPYSFASIICIVLIVVFTLGTCMHTNMLYCILTCVQQVCMPCSINRGVHLEGVQGEQHQLWSLSVNTIHLFVYLLSFLLSLRSIRDNRLYNLVTDKVFFNRSVIFN